MQTPKPDIIPLQVRRHHTAWVVEQGHFELEVNTKFNAWLYEALDTDAPADALVNCCLGNKVQFYQPSDEKDKWREYRGAQHMDFNMASDTLLHVGGAWWKVFGGNVLRRNERWVFRHHLRRNDRLAHLLNKGPKGDSYAPTLDLLMKNETTEKGRMWNCGNCGKRWFQPSAFIYTAFTYCPHCCQEIRPVEQEGTAPAHERVEKAM